jgi:hypothetical protein
MGCSKNCTSGLVPIKWENWLKIVALNTDVILITKCCNKKIIKKRPDKAMATFRKMVDDKSELM